MNRFSQDNIFALVEVLEIPDPFRTSNKCVFRYVEALCLLCARFRVGADIGDLVMKYNRSSCAISGMINDLVVFLDDRWHHLLEFDIAYTLHPAQLHSYAQAVYESSCPVHTIIGFLDDTIHPICRPSEYQRQAYNGHKKHHALKYQALILPNGLIGHLYGPEEGRRNDNWLLTASRLCEQLKQHAHQEGSHEHQAAAERFLHVYGDAAYECTDTIIGPFTGFDELTAEEKEWNKAMGKLCIAAEHGFKLVSSYWPFLEVTAKQKIFSSPIGLYYRVAVLLTNAMDCLYPNQISKQFDLPPPLLQDYFHH